MADGDWDKALRLLDKSLRFKPDNNVRTPAQVVQAYPTAHGRFILTPCCLGVVLQAEAHVLKHKATAVSRSTTCAF
jgi:hypothetical protein